ncbi:MAG: glycosyltransferase [Anaerolineae bacterium]
MRLLALAPTGFFADYGCHVRIRGQMAALQARGHTVRIVTYPSGPRCRPSDHGPAPPLARAPRHAGGIVPPQAAAGRAAGAHSAARRAASFPGGRPHIIHAYLHEGALLGALLARLLAAPLIFDFPGQPDRRDAGPSLHRAALLPAARAAQAGELDRPPAGRDPGQLAARG